MTAGRAECWLSAGDKVAYRAFPAGFERDGVDAVGTVTAVAPCREGGRMARAYAPLIPCLWHREYDPEGTPARGWCASLVQIGGREWRDVARGCRALSPAEIAP